MNLNIPWPLDPKDNKPSVSLGILCLATVAVVIAIGMQLAGKAHDISLVSEWWFGSAGLYFSRRMKWSKGEVGPVDSGDQK